METSHKEPRELVYLTPEQIVSEAYGFENSTSQDSKGLGKLALSDWLDVDWSNTDWADWGDFGQFSNVS